MIIVIVYRRYNDLFNLHDAVEYFGYGSFIYKPIILSIMFYVDLPCMSIIIQISSLAFL